MSRSKASKVLLIVVAMLLGWGSAIQLARYPARLRGSLGIRHYINMEYAPDGKTLATAEQGENSPDAIRVWDVKTCRERLILNTTAGDIQGIRFSPDGRYLAARYGPGTWKLWDTADGSERPLFSTEDSNSGSTRADLWFSPDSKLVILAIDSFLAHPRVRFIDIATGEALSPFEGQTYPQAFSRDGQQAAIGRWNSSGEGSTLRLWDARTRKYRLIVGLHRKVQSLAFSPDGRILASGTGNLGRETEIRLWDTGSLRERARLVPEDDNWRYPILKFTPEGRLLAGGLLWNIDLEKPQKVLHLGFRWPVFTRDGDLGALLDDKSGVVELLEDDKRHARLSIRAGDFLVGDWITGNLLAGGKLLYVKGRRHERETNPTVQWIAEHLKLGKRSDLELASQFWDSKTGKEVATFDGWCEVSPDEETLATHFHMFGSGGEDEIKLWEFPPYRPVQYVIGLWLSGLLLAYFIGSWCLGLATRRWLAGQRRAPV